MTDNVDQKVEQTPKTFENDRGPIQDEPIRNTTPAQKRIDDLQTFVDTLADKPGEYEEQPEVVQDDAQVLEGADQGETTPEQIDEPEEVVEDPVDEGRKEKEDHLASKFAALSHRDRELRERETIIREKEAQLQQFDVLRDRLKDDPIGTLQEDFGVSFQDLANHQLASMEGGDDTPVRIRAMERKIDQRFSDFEKKEAQQLVSSQQANVDQAVSDFKSQIDVALQAGEYPAISTKHKLGTDMVKQVYDVVEMQYERTGRILTPQEALDLTEKHFRNEIEETYKVLNPGTESTTQATPSEQTQTQANDVTRTRTLNNGHATRVSQPEQGRQLTRAEEVERFAESLKFGE